MNSLMVYVNRNYGVIAFVFFGVLFIPVQFYISNVKDFQGDYYLLLPFFAGAVVLLVAGIFVNLGDRLQALIWAFGLSIFIVDQFFQAEIRPLDGQKIGISSSTFIEIVQILIVIFISLFTLYFLKKLRKPMTDVSFLLFFLMPFIFSYSLYVSKQYQSNDLNYINDRGEISTDKPNVYLIWLDAMQTDYMAQYIDTSSKASKYNGFNLFVNNSANYLYTIQSYASFMSGTVYEGGDFGEWVSKGDSLRRSLKDAGYRITTYAKSDFLSAIDDEKVSSDQLYSQRTKVRHPYVKDFLTFWIVRTLPSIFSSVSVRFGELLGDKMFLLYNSNANYLKVKTIADGIEPLTGVFTLDQLISDESNRAGAGELVIAQAIIPHGPYVIDEKCNYRGVSNMNPSGSYALQVECAAKKVEMYFDKLTALGRYESSIIILMGDHGAGWAGLIDGVSDGSPALNSDYTPWSKDMVVSRASALLMIKPQNKGSYEDLLNVSKKESQLVDLYPTLLSMLDIKAASNIGRNLFSTEKLQEREKYITYFKPSRVIPLYQAKKYNLHYGDGEKGILDISFGSDLVDENSIPALDCGESLLFSGSDHSTQRYLSYGLDAEEPWGRWSNSRKVQLSFRLPQNNCKDGSLTLNLRAFIGGKQMVQTGKVYFNENEIGYLTTKKSSVSSYELKIPANLIKNGRLNRLEFSIESPASPSSLGIGSDTRLLGFGFESITYH